MAVITAAAIGAAGSIAGGFLSGGGGDASKLQKRARAWSQPLPTQLNIEGLGNFGVSGGRDDVTITGGVGQFGELSELLQGLAFQQSDRGPLFDLGATGLGPEQLGVSSGRVNDAFAGLQSSLGALQSFDQDEFAAQQFDRLQSLASRGEEIAANRVGQSLFSRGRLGGDDTTSSTAFEGLARAQEDARTQRALQAFGLADQAFQQRAETAGLNLQALQQAQLGQQANIQGFTGLQGLLSADRQQNLQNVLGLSLGAGDVLAPTFRGIETALQARLTDQANRVSAATGAAGAASPIMAQQAQARSSALGNAFGGIVDAVAGSNINIFGQGGQ